MSGTDWVKRGKDFVWDDRVVDQKTATEYQGDGAEYKGKSATVYSKQNGKELDKTELNSDGTVTQGNST